MPDDLAGGLRKLDDEYKKWKKRAEQARRLLDEETRAATVVELAVEWLPALLDRALGLETPFDQMPYWKYHKTHFQVLQEAVQVFSTFHRAEDRRREAERLVDQVERRAARVLDEFAEGGAKWNALLRTVGERTLAVGLQRMDADQRPAARDPRGVLDLAVNVRALRARVDEQVAEVVGHWAALRLCGPEVERLLREREEKVRSLERRRFLGLGRIAAWAARRDDDLTAFPLPARLRAGQAVDKFWRLVLRWAERADQ